MAAIDGALVMVLLAIACVAVLLATAPIGIMVGESPRAGYVVYGICLIASLALLLIALLGLSVWSDAPSSATLPLGLPWLGAHFRVDALAAFFLAVVNLGGAGAIQITIGYGQHEHAPRCCRSISISPA
jgi:formate hydrogenlyase subunit 3/multisubunit Na+/H+ antiporter MnhD subunit